ncbi:hypothetical protein CIPAW_14G076600 [Carya illinoinensis]|uniref:Uncharacterized protein n=1 Tax=Carya illinoinensis TaxID=32201 RepID=A0A8T1NK98_CARIL|nr:hypothetical protein CIPAW_14G076600 [Carya illinoinensis]
MTTVATHRILNQVQLLITWKMLDISLMMGHFSLGNSVCLWLANWNNTLSSGATHADVLQQLMELFSKSISGL